MSEVTLNNFKDYIIKQPAFYKRFSCMGGACPASCCENWRIDWEIDEVKKLKKAECSEKLKKLIMESFSENPQTGKMQIKMTSDNSCPFLDDEKYCMIQKELGHEILSNTCRIYPRDGLLSGRMLMRTCRVSCYQVLEMLSSNPGAMDISYTKIKSTVKAKYESPNTIADHPQLKYRSVLFDFFYEALSDSSKSIESAVVICALAAQKFDQFISRGEFDRIPEIIPKIKPQLNDESQIKKIDSFRPNYQIKFAFSKELIELLNKQDFIKLLYDENNMICPEKYVYGITEFDNNYSDRPFFFRNIALNILFEQRIPYYDIEMSIYDNWCYFAAELAVIKLMIAAAAFAFRDDPEKGYKLAIANVTRALNHNDDNRKSVIDLMRKHNIISPAHLALLIK